MLYRTHTYTYTPTHFHSSAKQHLLRSSKYTLHDANGNICIKYSNPCLYENIWHVPPACVGSNINVIVCIQSSPIIYLNYLWWIDLFWWGDWNEQFWKLIPVQRALNKLVMLNKLFSFFHDNCDKVSFQKRKDIFLLLFIFSTAI